MKVDFLLRSADVVGRSATDIRRTPLIALNPSASSSSASSAAMPASSASLPPLRSAPSTALPAPPPHLLLGAPMPRATDETREIEFKSLWRTQTQSGVSAAAAITGGGVGLPPGTFHAMCDKYVNAFLNGNGGVLCVGVDDTGIVHGLILDQ